VQNAVRFEDHLTVMSAAARFEYTWQVDAQGFRAVDDYPESEIATCAALL